MSEDPHAGEGHGDAVLVGRLDHLVVADRAPRLDHRRRPGFDRLQQPVGEGEEGVGRAGRALGQRLRLAGGLLVQDRDNGRVTADQLKCVTKRQPTAGELADCLFAWTIAKHVKSNAIVYAKDGATAGIGAGQMNRRDSARIAAAKAIEAAQTNNWPEPRTIGSAVASDAFFPFADGLLAAAEAGATAVIQPGGSIRDDEVIAAADDAGLAMLFTGMRHFRH